MNCPDYKSPVKKETDEELAERIIKFVRMRPFVKFSEVTKYFEKHPDRIKKIFKKFGIKLQKEELVKMTLKKLRNAEQGPR